MPITKVCYLDKYEWHPYFVWFPRWIQCKDNPQCYMRCCWVWLEQRKRASPLRELTLNASVFSSLAANQPDSG